MSEVNVYKGMIYYYEGLLEKRHTDGKLSDQEYLKHYQTLSRWQDVADERGIS